MQRIEHISELRKVLRQEKAKGKSIGFVPTMGALHEGHISLVKMSKAECDVTVVSIFVNPTQFAPNEDLSKYPRTLEADCKMLEADGVDIAFIPTVTEMYPPGATTFVTVDGVTAGFEGVIRPEHFRGVATVVSSLFHIVSPDKAFFGQKDAQQVAVIKKMVHDQHFPLDIVVGETVRESDGLAMSSRNRYLSPEDRSKALSLSTALFKARDLVAGGGSFSEARNQGLQIFAEMAPDGLLEYLDFVHPETFTKITSFKESESVIAIMAARIGTTRLIDNVVLHKQ